jgi:hypothetical protein
MLFSDDHEAFRQSVRGVLAREVLARLDGFTA